MGGQFLVYEIPCLSSCLLTDYIYIFLRRYSEDSFEINLVFLIKREKESTFIQLFHPSFLSFSSFSFFHYSNILFCEVTCFETLLLSSHRAKKNFWISWSLLSGACVDQKAKKKKREEKRKKSRRFSNATGRGRVYQASWLIKASRGRVLGIEIPGSMNRNRVPLVVGSYQSANIFPGAPSRVS